MLNTYSRLAVADERDTRLAPQHPLIDTYLAPTAIQAAARTHLAYELHLTNVGQSDTHLVSVQVTDHAQPLESLLVASDSLLADWVVQLGKPWAEGGELCVGPGQRAVVLVHLSFDDPAQVPNELEHEVICSCRTDGMESALISRGALVHVRKKPPLCLGPPVRGGNWYVLNAFDAGKYGHRGAIRAHARHGGAVDPQRYAIDLIQIDGRGRTCRGTGDRNRDSYCYGQEVVAVSTAVVVSARDDIPDNRPGIRPTLPDPDAAGNHVVLDMLNGHYAFYAHLRPGTLRVQEGDRVSRGEVLGFVGSSGRSDRPHLHFHVADSDAFYAEGLPYVFKRFELVGRRSFDDLLSNDGSWDPDIPTQRRHEMPLEETIIRF